MTLTWHDYRHNGRHHGHCPNDLQVFTILAGVGLSVGVLAALIAIIYYSSSVAYDAGGRSNHLVIGLHGTLLAFVIDIFVIQRFFESECDDCIDNLVTFISLAANLVCMAAVLW